MASRSLPLAVVAALLVAVPLASAGVPGTLPPVGIRSNSAWRTATTGPTNPLRRQAPQLLALTARSNSEALTPFGVNGGLEKLDAAAALIWVMTVGRGGVGSTFKHASWPPRLAEFRLDRGWEGQPLPRIQQRLLPIAVRGWNLDVRVYFGTQHPSHSLLVAVQAELNRLVLPAQ